MKAVTHPGRFHADEVFALAALRTIYGELEIVRTRDEREIVGSDIKVDIGGRDDADAGAFDHHQRGGAGKRDSGIPYASFGLVWRRHGAEICESAAAAAKVDKILVQPIDAVDNGFELTRSLVRGVEPFTVSRIIGSLNPTWEEDLDPSLQDERFEEAMALATLIIERQVSTAVAHERAVPLLREAIARSPDPRIVELERRLPWRGLISGASPEALLVICQYPDRWGVHTVPSGGGGFARRIDLPARWAGLEDEALVDASGVDDAIFCHRSRHFVAATSRNGAIALAKKAVEATADE